MNVDRPKMPGVGRLKAQPLPSDACGSCCWCRGTVLAGPNGQDERCPHGFACCRNCNRCHPKDFHDDLGGDHG